MRIAFVVVLFAYGCGKGEKAGPSGDDTGATVGSDVDGDGYAEPEDCDDSDPQVNPGATEEPYNGVDDDCNPDTPDDDLDGDGLLVADDCDDTDATVGLPTAWYADADADGYPDPSNEADACVETSGYLPAPADDAWDCDDTDPDVHPAADDAWYDGVDSDCDGSDNPDACVAPPPEGTVAADDTCAYSPDVGGFEPQFEWRIDSFADQPDSDGVSATPVVGQLTDDNGDGAIDDGDTPDIVVVTRNRAGGEEGVLRVISGDGSGVITSVSDQTWAAAVWRPSAWSGVALGDIDGDGAPDMAFTVMGDPDGVFAGGCYLAAAQADGTLLWVYRNTDVGCQTHAPALADLDGDGAVEVILGDLVVEGADGSLRFEGGGGKGRPDFGGWGDHSFAMDLDGDGQQEVIAGSSVYEPDGSERCETGGHDGYPAVADLDGDGRGEIVVVAGGTVSVYEDDCSLASQWSIYGGGDGGPPLIADVDGDGTPEIGVTGSSRFTVYSPTGSRKWSATVDDPSASAGASAFDFDGDGIDEVVFADAEEVHVFEGMDGSERFAESNYESTTLNGYPVEVDVDGDGKVEILVGEDGESYTGLFAIGDKHDQWVSAGRVWNQDAWSITNVNDDLTIPATPAVNWSDTNSFRQGQAGSLDPQAAPDLVPSVVGVCQAACGENVDVMVTVANQGALRAPGDVDITIQGEDSDGNRTSLAFTTLGDHLDPGVVTTAYTLTVPVSQALAHDRLLVVVDRDGGSTECDETNDEAEIDLSGVCE